MGVFFVNGELGSDSNDGLTRETAKATINGVRAITTWNALDLIYIAAMTYTQAAVYFNSGADNLSIYLADPYYPGVVLFDFGYSSTTAGSTEGYFGMAGGINTTFVNLQFKGMAASKAAIRHNDSSYLSALHCVFYNDTFVNAWGWRDGVSAVGECRNCSFYNLQHGTVGWYTTRVYNCYFNSCTLPLNNEILNRFYNAYPGNTEPTGIDTTGADPGFVDASNGDFRIDSTNTSAYNALFTGGQNGDRIGAIAGAAMLYNSYFTPFYLMSPVPNAAAGNQNIEWFNEGPNGTNTYTEGTPGDVYLFGTLLRVDTSSAATGGRVMSDVWHAGEAGDAYFHSASWTYIESLLQGAVIDTDTTLPRKIEYRYSSSSFVKTDVSPTWIPFESTDAFSHLANYIQFRITFQTGHSGA